MSFRFPSVTVRLTLSFALLISSAAAGPSKIGQHLPTRYIVILQDAPVAARVTRRAELQAAPAIAYKQQIERRQTALMVEMRNRRIQVDGSTSTLLNAIFVTAGADRVAELRSLPGVLGVRPMRYYKRMMNKATQLMNAPAAWTVVGGAGNAGAGMKIGILDTGIDQNHPAFQDSSLSVPAGFPICTNGHPEDCAYTNNKVIVARSYVRMTSSETGIADDYSPRDRFGHGTAVASAAAGNTNTGAVTFSGMAPKAYIGNYKIWGSPGVNDFLPDDVLIQAITDALSDGMDVVNLSSGGPAIYGALDTGAACGESAGTPCDPLAAAYENAAQQGLVITIAAGNDNGNALVYPAFNSVSSPGNAPSVIAVGATTNAHVFLPAVSVNGSDAPANVKNIAAQPSDSFFTPSQLGANAAPLVDVTALGDDGTACNALPANSLTNAYALIQRGNCSFAQKATNAQLSGAIGVIFFMADGSAPILPSGLTFNGPGVMISQSDGQVLKSYLAANPGRAVTIDYAGTEVNVDDYVNDFGFSPAAANQLAAYSSTGPAPDGSIKPDMVAVGGFDLFQASGAGLPVQYGLYVATQSYDPTLDINFETLYSTNGYMAADGTSVSAPIVAGAAALIKQAHPNYTVGQIKSALVNSAAQDVSTDDFGDPVDTEWLGAGRLDAGAAINATVAAEPASVSFGFVTSSALPISRAIKVTNRGSASVTLAAALVNGTPAAGTTVAVDQSSLTLAPGASTTLNVTLSGSLPAPGEYSGAVTLQGSGASLRLPFMLLVTDGIAANAKIVQASAFGSPGTDGGQIWIQVTDQFGVPVPNSPVRFASSQRGALTWRSVSGAPACSPNNSPTNTTCNTDNYGVAYVDILLGSRLASPDITVTAAGQSFDLGTALMLPLPQITSGAVTGAANSASGVAPGSLAIIQGTDLVDPGVVVNVDGDGATTAILPLTLDYVTVGFNAAVGTLGVPGFMSFAGPNQVTVQVPWELQGQSSASVNVVVDEGLYSNAITVPLVAYAPAFYESNGLVVATDATANAAVSSTAPVAAGDTVQLFVSGLGPVVNQPPSGTPASDVTSTTTTVPVVKIGGQTASVVFSGLAPGITGVYRVDVTIPSGLSTGSQSVTVAIGGVTSPASKIPVK